MIISGLNFVNSGLVRVAFVAESETSTIRTKDSIIVDARFRSSSHLVCVSPPLVFPGSEPVAAVKVYVCLNGVDFDSIALPRDAIKFSCANNDEKASQKYLVEEATSIASESRRIKNQPVAYPVSISYDSDRYLLVQTELTTDDLKLTQHPVLEYRARVYQIPNVVCVRPTDGVYTSHLTFDGSNFTNTGVAVGTCLGAM